MFTKTQLAVATISTAIYLDTLRYEFTYDDKKAVVTNIDVQEVRNSHSSSLRDRPTAKRFRPSNKFYSNVSIIYGMMIFGVTKCQCGSSERVGNRHNEDGQTTAIDLFP